MTPEEKKQRKAEDAKRLLNDPILREALRTLKDTCFTTLKPLTILRQKRGKICITC